MKNMSKNEAQQKAVRAVLEQRLKNREKYYENPKKCLECNSELNFEKKITNFALHLVLQNLTIKKEVKEMRKRK